MSIADVLLLLAAEPTEPIMNKQATGYGSTDCSEDNAQPHTSEYRFAFLS
jgi:hypothetical protein